MRKRYIVANWKMNHGDNTGVQYVKNMTQDLQVLSCNDLKKIDIVVCPPMLLLRELSMMSPALFSLGAQNCAPWHDGAHTGEVSAEMLRRAGCRYVILGHSERRQHFHESNDMIHEKGKRALSAGLIPIICIGESLEAREKNNVYDIVSEQVMGSTKDLKSFMLAYEPVWSIGTGQLPDAHEIGQMITYLKSDIPTETSVLYGGSVHGDNIEIIARIPSVDGVLVGGASFKRQDFLHIVASLSGGTVCNAY